jgi:hypothetical protein
MPQFDPLMKLGIEDSATGNFVLEVKIVKNNSSAYQGEAFVFAKRLPTNARMRAVPLSFTSRNSEILTVGTLAENRILNLWECERVPSVRFEFSFEERRVGLNSVRCEFSFEERRVRLNSVRC